MKLTMWDDVLFSKDNIIENPDRLKNSTDLGLSLFTEIRYPTATKGVKSSNVSRVTNKFYIAIVWERTLLPSDRNSAHFASYTYLRLKEWRVHCASVTRSPNVPVVTMWSAQVRTKRCSLVKPLSWELSNLCVTQWLAKKNVFCFWLIKDLTRF